MIIQSTVTQSLVDVDNSAISTKSDKSKIEKITAKYSQDTRNKTFKSLEDKLVLDRAILRQHDSLQARQYKRLQLTLESHISFAIKNQPV